MGVRRGTGEGDTPQSAHVTGLTDGLLCAGLRDAGIKAAQPLLQPPRPWVHSGISLGFELQSPRIRGSSILLCAGGHLMSSLGKKSIEFLGLFLDRVVFSTPLCELFIYFGINALSDV